jgi:hypothetical protein
VILASDVLYVVHNYNFKLWEQATCAVPAAPITTALVSTARLHQTGMRNESVSGAVRKPCKRNEAADSSWMKIKDQAPMCSCEDEAIALDNGECLRMRPTVFRVGHTQISSSTRGQGRKNRGGRSVAIYIYQ